MAQFYHDLITEKSFQFLQTLGRNYRFVLIGGWAVFFYTRALKSKDIDIVVDYDELGRLGKNFNLIKNDRLKKYEIKTGEFDMDIYVAHYSNLGIPAEDIIAQAVAREGFILPPPELLLILKIHAWLDRRGSAKGRKDELDILGLAFFAQCDWAKYQLFLRKYKLKPHGVEFLTLLKNTRSLPELNLNEQQVAKLRKKTLKALEII